MYTKPLKEITKKKTTIQPKSFPLETPFQFVMVVKNNNINFTKSPASDESCPSEDLHDVRP